MNDCCVRRFLSRCAVAASLLAFPAASNAAEFFVIDHMSGEESKGIEGVSADGGVVVGKSNGLGDTHGNRIYDTEAWRWTAATGLMPLAEQLGDTRTYSLAWSVSADGSTIVAGKSTEDGMKYDEPFRWTEQQGFVSLKLPPDSLSGMAFDGSPDGSVAVGRYLMLTSERFLPANDYYRQVPCFWTSDGGVVSLGLRDGFDHSWATEVSFDGSVIAGRSRSSFPDDTTIEGAWVWTKDTGYVDIGSGIVTDMNSDGSVVVGLTTPSYREFRWTADGGMEILSTGYSYPTVSSDGTLVYGIGPTGSASVWDREHGHRDLRDVLIAEFGMANELRGWQLLLVTASSPNDQVLGGTGISPSGDRENWIAILDPPLQAGDADQDWDFDQLDLVQVQVAGKYLSGEPATWGEGDWNGAPAVLTAKPPSGDERFNQLDIVVAQQAGLYLTGSYEAGQAGIGSQESQVSVGYDANTGEIWVEPAAGVDLTAINIDSSLGIFTGQSAQNLGGSFDNDADDNIFKATFGSSFGAFSLGNVAQVGLQQELVSNDLTIVGSLAGGGELGDVKLVYVPLPEPSSLFLTIVAGFISLVSTALSRRQWSLNSAHRCIGSTTSKMWSLETKR